MYHPFHRVTFSNLEHSYYCKSCLSNIDKGSVHEGCETIPITIYYEASAVENFRMMIN